MNGDVWDVNVPDVRRNAEVARPHPRTGVSPVRSTLDKVSIERDVDSDRNQRLPVLR